MFKSVKKYWRLVFGLSFIASGASMIETVPVTPYLTIAAGAALVVWHFIHRRCEAK